MVYGKLKWSFWCCVCFVWNVLDMWWHYTAGDTLRNGNMATSSLAAKGFRSVRPNLQDKKSPTLVGPLCLAHISGSCFFSPSAGHACGNAADKRH